MNFLSQFCNSHHLGASDNYESIRGAVDALYQCNEITGSMLDAALSESPRQNFLNVAYSNLIARIYEHADAMLVCIAVDSFASAEVLARVVVESSINLMYLSNHGLETPLLGYLERWLQSHEQTLLQWKQHEEEAKDTDDIVRIIEKRIEWLSTLRGFFETAIKELGLDHQPSNDVWPRKIFKRFTAVGQNVAYYTSYHRLSSSSHVLAEDTLIWLFGYSLSDPSALEEMGVEAVNYSIMMAHIALIFYIDSLESLACAYKEKEPLLVFAGHRVNLEKTVEELSVHAGCPR